MQQRIKNICIISWHYKQFAFNCLKQKIFQFRFVIIFCGFKYAKFLRIDRNIKKTPLVFDNRSIDIIFPIFLFSVTKTNDVMIFSQKPAVPWVGINFKVVKYDLVKNLLHFGERLSFKFWKTQSGLNIINYRN
jgi:hypothetical protein